MVHHLLLFYIVVYMIRGEVRSIRDRPYYCRVTRTTVPKKLGSRKLKAPFLKVNASCKFPGCAKYSFKLKKEPVPGTECVCLKIQRRGSVCHERMMVQKRHLSGTERTEVGKELQTGVRPWYYGKLSTMSKAEKNAGNLNSCKTAEVLRKLISEQRSQEQLHHNPLQKVMIL